ncbi:hypothetical protein LTR36_007799 [Oleoguttula mirabilis]|uniref:TPR-like protein n=1 Tax=Oleoguttula mirabilis TaxID=1507867 RepID=A0AAV9J9J1_9PEZI|nr:hypothetical protein LTR36_007799 [Oleoguttula mirabilis]
MADALLVWLRQSLPSEIADLTEPYISKLEHGDYQSLLESEEAKTLFGHINDSTTEHLKLDEFPTWSDLLFHRLGSLLADRSRPEKGVVFFCIGYAALLAFLQSNVTGPPLQFSSAHHLLPKDVAESPVRTEALRTALLASLSLDGIAAYKLTPNIELLCLADVVMTSPAIMKGIGAARLAKVRVAFMQQRLLSEVSSTLQDVIYDDLGLLEARFDQVGEAAGVEFLLERATIHIHHGLDKLARADLERAKQERRFEYALTGLLGKRTKFQEKDISQLVVLARSAVDDDVGDGESANGTSSTAQASTEPAPRPAKLDLNDDTLLESISFSEKPADSVVPENEVPLPPGLKSLDPSNQPQLDPLDSVLLLSFASSITNTSPQHGLTREETLPYAIRVLDGGSSNWQVYTQALLVRSRIEGYRSRTVERGLLQLQALVDQVIADTATAEPLTNDGDGESSVATSFLPRPKESESASVTERLRYIFQLASPTRWDLEAELAARWVQLGGLRSALEIYERLEMWAEAALCWAATEREDKAKNMVRRQLFHATKGGLDVPEIDVGEDETWEGPERSPPPLDAPRLYSILGDIDQDVPMYEKAWEVSNQRYARAQRSLGRMYFSAKDFVKAAESYSKSLKVNQLNHASWFALGCVLLELAQFEKAVEAFSRCVQLEDTDAEAWSNLGAALLRTEPKQSDTTASASADADSDDIIAVESKPDPQRNRYDALQALKRAASLKHDSYRIWENVLTIAASLSPPDYTSMLSAQRRIIDLRGSTDGEKCVDKQILDMLARHVIATTDQFDPSKPGLVRMFVKFMDESVVPLITGSADLWQLVGRLAIWRNKPSSALEAEEKAWRAVTSQPGWETENEQRWNSVVEATVRLCDSYESLGPKQRTEGMGAGEPVAKDWNFKARSAVRGIMGKAKSTWEDTEGWERLQETMQGLKA